jgi:hypothetical protein
MALAAHAPVEGGREQFREQRLKEIDMDDLVLFVIFSAAGYVLAIYTWPAVRTFFAGAEQEIDWLKGRLGDLENKVRDAFNRRG